MEELGEPDRDWTAFQEIIAAQANASDLDYPDQWDERDEPEWQRAAFAGDPLVLMYENQWVCRWAVPLEEADDPVVLAQHDGMSGWRMESERFSSFVYSHVWDYRLVQYAACVLKADAEPITAESLARLRAHFREAPASRHWPMYDTPHRYDHYRFIGPDGLSRILVEDISSGRSIWHLAADSLLALGQLATILRDQGGFVDDVDVRLRCLPGLDASWNLAFQTSSGESRTLGQLIDRLGREGKMGLMPGWLDADGKVLHHSTDRGRHRTYTCVSDDDSETPRPPKSPQMVLPGGTVVKIYRSYSRQRGNATDG